MPKNLLRNSQTSSNVAKEIVLKLAPKLPNNLLQIVKNAEELDLNNSRTSSEITKELSTKR